MLQAGQGDVHPQNLIGSLRRAGQWSEVAPWGSPAALHMTGQVHAIAVSRGPRPSATCQLPPSSRCGPTTPTDTFSASPAGEVCLGLPCFGSLPWAPAALL